MGEFMEPGLVGEWVHRVDRDRPIPRNPQAVAVELIKGDLPHVERLERLIPIPGGELRCREGRREMRVLTEAETATFLTAARAARESPSQCCWA